MKISIRLFKRIILSTILYAISLNLIAQVPLVFTEENTGASCSASAGNLANNPNLPDPFTFHNGSKVSTFEDWSCRRSEIKADLEQYEIGDKPDKPSDITASYSGGTLTVTIKENGQTLTLTSEFSLPSGSGPHAMVIGMNSGTGGLSSNLFDGIAQIPFNHDQVLSYAAGSGSRNSNDPYYRLYPQHANSGKYSGWSWGISRLIDGLEIVADQLNLDMSRIAVTGCSYAGKMALFGGALDERIALTIVQESGGGGINAWRTSQDFNNRTGTNIEKINNTNGSWFMQSMMSRDPYSLPHDHHELIAMIAPRAVLILGNPDMVWLGDESGYKSTMAALEVWKAMGVEDRLGFDFASGHSHCVAASSQNTSATTFINRFLRNQSTNTEIRKAPSNSGFDLNYQSSINWTTPTITFNPNIPNVTISLPNGGVAVNQEITISAIVEDANNDVTQVEFFINDEKIGEATSSPYSVNWENEGAGLYNIQVKVSDAEGNTGTSSQTIEVRAPQSPYGGSPHAIPGVIEFEEYDTGGADSAYYDSSPGSETGVSFRDDEDVDIEECTDTDGGYNIGWGTAGEWLEYTVDVMNSGTYAIDIRVACDGTGRTLDLEVNGTPIASDIAIPNTGGWQTWETVTIDDVVLSAGTQIIRATIGNTDYINLNHMTFRILTVTSADFTSNDKVICGPNPFEDNTIIMHAGHFDYEVSNAQGHILEYGSESNQAVFGASLSAGVYLLKVSDDNGQEVIKVIKR